MSLSSPRKGHTYLALYHFKVSSAETNTCPIFMSSSRSKGTGAQKGGARRHEINKIYTNPLPLLFIEPPPSRVQSILGLLGLSLTRVEYPHCEGVFDPITHSVWVSNHDHSMILWRRGFFGKGDLSRSEPSWLARQINIRKSGGGRMSI